MKYQQKQLQDREQRRTELFGAMSKKPSETTIPIDLMGNGKVRAMFDERRRGAGIDRSQPLKPITASGTGATTSKANGNASVRNNGINTAPSKTTNVKTRSTLSLGTVKRVAGGREITNSLATLTLDNDTIDNGVGIHSRRNSYGSHQSSESDRLNNNFTAEKTKSSINNLKSPIKSMNGKSVNTIVLAPVRAKKPVLPSVSPIASGRQTMNPQPRKPTVVQQKPTENIRTPPRKTATTKVKLTQSISQMNQAPRAIAPPEGMQQCRFCHRNFLEERLPKHEAVCAKLSTAKRKIFDASKHRVRGTEAEQFVKKGFKTTATAKQTAPTVPALRIGSNSALKKNNWRQKHEEFIAAIRAAKQVQAHLARGGKLADLPPPPPSENPDYIQCPHCGRRFNQAAAERHIPKCANMLHNKPKPGTVGTTKRR